MGALDSSGELSILDIFRNKEDSSTANPGANSNQNLKALSEFFASGSTVGNVDGTGTANTTDDRNALNSAPYSFSEFYSANYPNDIFSNVVAKDSTGTSVMDNGYVDGETARIYWDIDDGTTDDYTAGLKDATSNAILVSGTLDDDGNNKTVYKEVTVPAREHNDDDYYPFVSTGTFSNVVGANINHYDAIASVSINDPSNRTVATDTTTATETHTATIGDADSLSAYAWTFAKDGTVTADGGNPSPTTATTASPTVTYTGPGRYTSVLTVKGGRNEADTATSTAVEARNSVTSTTQTFDIEYTDAVTVTTPSNMNEGGTVSLGGTHKGLAGGAKIGIVDSEADTTFLVSDTTDTQSSQFVARTISKSVTATGGTNNTIVAQVRIEDKAASTTNANSSNFNIYPLISQEFASGDISVSVDPVIVGANTVLSVGNVTDNITGYAWSNQGTGTMTSTNATGGATGGATATIINEQTAATNTVSFNTAQANKTIRLTLHGRNSQTATADKTLNVELADAVAINSISDINGGSSVTVSGTQAGLQYGAFFGLVNSTTATTFLSTKTSTDSTDSRYTSDAYTATITPANQNTTQTLQGRVVDRTSTGTAGTAISANTSTFTVHPLLTTSKNTINPTSQTIYSTTRNTDTSTYPTSFTFGTPGTQTDNITSRTYSETSGNLTITANATPSSQTATQATVQAGVSATGAANVTYTVVGTGATTTQTTATNCAVTVDFSKEIYSLGAVAVGGDNDTVNDTLTFSFSWQGFALNSTRFELFNSAGTAQQGNDSDSTSFTGGNAQTAQTQTVTLGSQASVFSHTTGGTYKIKISLFSDGSQSTLVKSGFTNTFTTNSISDITSILKGLAQDSQFVGWETKLQAAEESGTEVTYNGAIGSGALYALNVNVGSKISPDNDLGATYDFTQGDGNYYHYDGTVLEIGSDGIIDSSTDATPATPAINSSAVSTAVDDITIRVTADATMIATFTVSVTPSGGSEATNNVNASNQGSSLSQDISLKTIGFSSLAAGTSHVIKVRGNNSGENGSYSSTRTFSTDSAAVDWTTEIADFNINGNQTLNKTCVLVNGSGDVDIVVQSGITIAYKTSAGASYSAYASSHSNIGFSSGTFYISIKAGAAARFSDVKVLTVKSDNATSGDGIFTTAITLVGTDEGESCIHNTIPVNISLNETRYIHQLTVGDMVLSYNMEKDIIEETEILDMRTPQHDNLYKVIFDDNQELLLTDDHPIFTLDNTLVSIKPDYTLNRYQLDAEQLVVGDEIKIINSSKEIVSFEKYEGEHDTYTIMTKNNNFYADGVLVHSEISSE